MAKYRIEIVDDEKDAIWFDSFRSFDECKKHLCVGDTVEVRTVKKTASIKKYVAKLRTYRVL